MIPRHYVELSLSTNVRHLSLLLVFCLALIACGGPKSDGQAPSISITQVPPASLGDRDQQDVIVGAVKGAKPGHQIVLYAKIGRMWWVQPMADAPTTAIFPDHTWRNETHLGMEYAALLVDSGYHPAANLNQLPKPGGEIVAITSISGQQSAASAFIDFSGYKWRARDSPSDRGGTRNLYDPRNVFTDRGGSLHLRITSRGTGWTCSELTLTRSLGYGTYSFDVEDTSALDPSAVFGMFTWDYSTKDPNHREFDIEISRWGDPNRRNAQYVIQPYYVAPNVWPFSAPAGNLTHTIVWEPGQITMSTYKRNNRELVAHHVFSPEVPIPGSESIRINLYAFSEHQHRIFPPLQRPQEVVVNKFSYLP